jgi:hypothetical protein
MRDVVYLAEPENDTLRYRLGDDRRAEKIPSEMLSVSDQSRSCFTHDCITAWSPNCLCRTDPVEYAGQSERIAPCQHLLAGRAFYLRLASPARYARSDHRLPGADRARDRWSRVAQERPGASSSTRIDLQPRPITTDSSAEWPSTPHSVIIFPVSDGSG